MFAYLYSHQHNSSLTTHCQSNSFIMYSKTKCQRSMATNNKFWQKFFFPTHFKDCKSRTDSQPSLTQTDMIMWK